MFTTYFASKPTSEKRRSAKRRATSQHRLALLPLEDRTVPTVTVGVNPKTLTLTLTGDAINETVSILETAGTTSINIDNNGDGALDQFLDSYVFMGGIRSFRHFEFNLGDGNDIIEFRVMHNIDTLRDFQITDLQGNNTTLFDANGYTLSNQLNLQYTGGSSADSVTTLFNQLNGANVTIGLNAGNGNNEYSLLYRGAVTNSNIFINQAGGVAADAANIFYQPESHFVHSQVSVSFTGGDGNDGFNTSINSARITDASSMNYLVDMGGGTDVLNYRLNSALADKGSNGLVGLHASLGTGNDTFTSTLGYDAGLIKAGSQAIFQVDGGSGDDLFFVAPVTFFGNDLVLDGSVSYLLNAGQGNDNVTFATLDILGGTNRALILGGTSNFLVQIDGGDGNDTINLFLNFFAAFPGLSNRATVNVLAGAGDDAVSLTGIGSPTAPNLGSVFIDGGSGTDTYAESFLIPFNRTVVNFEP